MVGAPHIDQAVIAAIEFVRVIGDIRRKISPASILAGFLSTRIFVFHPSSFSSTPARQTRRRHVIFLDIAVLLQERSNVLFDETLFGPTACFNAEPGVKAHAKSQKVRFNIFPHAREREGDARGISPVRRARTPHGS